MIEGPNRVNPTSPNKTDAGLEGYLSCQQRVAPPAGGALRVVFDKLCRSAPLTLAVA